MDASWVLPSAAASTSGVGSTHHILQSKIQTILATFLASSVLPSGTSLTGHSVCFLTTCVNSSALAKAAFELSIAALTLSAMFE